MRRKVIQQAKSAYTLTLPIEWVRENNLEKSREVDVEMQGRSLVVSNTGDVTEKRASLDVSGFLTKNIYLHINSLYARGVDEIEVIADRDISSVITGHLNHLVGYALVSQAGHRYVLRDIGGTGSFDLDTVFKHVFQSVILFFQSAIEDVFGKQKETLRGLTSRDLEVNKLCLYLQRAINKMSYGDAVKGRALFTYSFELEKISDDVLRFWRMNIEKKPRKSSELKVLATQCFELLGKAFDQYYSFSSLQLEALYALRKKIRTGVSRIKSRDNMANFILKIAEGILDLNQLTIMIHYD